jgi:hypothetical protein
LNCDIVIAVLDKIEELRPLSHMEFQLRILVKASLHNLNVARVGYWRQRAKIKDCVLGDENSAYFHMCATVRLRKNQIKRLEVQGVPVESHCGMQAVLHDFFKHLVGQARPNFFSFDLDSLLAASSLSSADVQALISPFSFDEIKTALWAIDCNSSPGPDGFGPAFFKQNWDLVKKRFTYAA